MTLIEHTSLLKIEGTHLRYQLESIQLGSKYQAAESIVRYCVFCDVNKLRSEWCVEKRYKYVIVPISQNKI